MSHIEQIYGNAILDPTIREIWTLNPIIPKYATIEAMAFANKGNFVYRQIVSEVCHVSKDRARIITQTARWKELYDVSVLRSVVKTLDTFMLCTDKEGILLFRTKDGEIDRSEAVYGSTPEFVSLCRLLFSEYEKIARRLGDMQAVFLEDLD